MPEKKKSWLKSKAIWAGILAVLVAVYNGLGAPLAEHFSITLPAIPEFVFALLGAFGIYGRKVADTEIK